MSFQTFSFQTVRLSFVSLCMWDVWCDKVLFLIKYQIIILVAMWPYLGTKRKFYAQIWLLKYQIIILEMLQILSYISNNLTSDERFSS